MIEETAGCFFCEAERVVLCLKASDTAFRRLDDVVVHVRFGLAAATAFAASPTRICRAVKLYQRTPGNCRSELRKRQVFPLYPPIRIVLHAGICPT
ncbi:hypothetical protein [Shinella sp.]|uniref:hypothetical protein n=1 Tax=Shinella sp. TaxID=1870904 RepID=UPI00403531A8